MGAELRGAVTRDAGRGGKSERLGEESTGETLDASLTGEGGVLGQKLEGRGSSGPMVDNGNHFGGTVVGDWQSPIGRGRGSKGRPGGCQSLARTRKRKRTHSQLHVHACRPELASTET